jgi:hypothetical protein
MWVGKVKKLAVKPGIGIGMHMWAVNMGPGMQPVQKSVPVDTSQACVSGASAHRARG